MAGRLAFRPACPADEAFLWQVYAETMRPQVQTFLVWRDDEQRARFRRFHRPEEAHIILFDGEDVGWLELHVAGAEAALHHFYLVSARQGLGIGSRVLRRVLDERCRGRVVRLGVLKDNPARRLYERFGFAAVAENGMKVIMLRPAILPAGR